MQKVVTQTENVCTFVMYPQNNKIKCYEKYLISKQYIANSDFIKLKPILEELARINWIEKH